MLVLARKIGETIIVNSNIRITVVDIRGGHVRLGIAAPDEVTVDRLEVHEKRKNLLTGSTEVLVDGESGISTQKRGTTRGSITTSSSR